MSKDSNEMSNPSADRRTSAGVLLSEVPHEFRGDVEWMDGMHVSAKEVPLPSLDEVPTPACLFELPSLHPDHPRGSKAMIDRHGANARLTCCRPRGPG